MDRWILGRAGIRKQSTAVDERCTSWRDHRLTHLVELAPSVVPLPLRQVVHTAVQDGIINRIDTSQYSRLQSTVNQSGFHAGQNQDVVQRFWSEDQLNVGGGCRQELEPNELVAEQHPLHEYSEILWTGHCMAWHSPAMPLYVSWRHAPHCHPSLPRSVSWRVVTLD